MARSISDEELQLRKRARRRLIGAIAIVIAVVVALPMVLDNEPKPLTQDIDIHIPSPDTAPFTSKVVPLPQSGGESKPSASMKPVPVPDAARPAASAQANGTAKEPAKTVQREKEAAAAPAKPQPAPNKTAVVPAGQFAVQIVALSDAAKAKQMQQAISKTGIKSYTEVIKTARGDVTRVRVGPFATREAAEKAQEKLKGAGFDGKVVPAR